MAVVNEYSPLPSFWFADLALTDSKGLLILDVYLRKDRDYDQRIERGVDHPIVEYYFRYMSDPERTLVKLRRHL